MTWFLSTEGHLLHWIWVSLLLYLIARNLPYHRGDFEFGYYLSRILLPGHHCAVRAGALSPFSFGNSEWHYSIFFLFYFGLFCDWCFYLLLGLILHKGWFCMDWINQGLWFYYHHSRVSWDVIATCLVFSFLWNSCNFYCHIDHHSGFVCHSWTQN